MTTGFARYPRLAFAAVALAVGMGVCLLASTRPVPVHAAQPDKKDEKGKDSLVPYSVVDPAAGYLTGKEPTFATAGKRFFGIGNCRDCHVGAKVDKAAGYEKYKSTEFVLLNESTTWSENDIHAAARKCLITDGKNGMTEKGEKTLGKQMEEVLQQTGRGPGYKVVEAAECLVCHSTDLAPRRPLAEKTKANFAQPDAVTCTACHGLHERWQLDHYGKPEVEGDPLPWRAVDPADKFNRGMHDLRNPVIKAALCASCHVGNAAEGKVVTHEMYAAGHPPLPPFELASYMEGEPKHWGYPTDEKLKYFATVKPEDTWKIFHFHPKEKESYLTRHYAVGAIVALRSEAELLVAEAKRATDKKEPLDFARFDCYACHHELRPTGERQARGYDGVPGRTPARAAAGVPAGVVAKHAEGITAGGLAAKAGGFDKQWLAFKKAVTDKPLGNPELIIKEGEALVAWCNAFLQVQSETTEPLYPADQAEKLLTALKASAVATKSVADPEAVMVLTWAVRTLSNENKPEPAEGKYKELAGVLPLNVRVPPYTNEAAKLPYQAKYPDRMKKISDFTTPNFLKAFEGAFGKK